MDYMDISLKGLGILPRHTKMDYMDISLNPKP